MCVSTGVGASKENQNFEGETWAAGLISLGVICWESMILCGWTLMVVPMFIILRRKFIALI